MRLGLKNAGTILLSVWLVLTGLLAIVSLKAAWLGSLLAILALAAGVVLLFERGRRHMAASLGRLLLSVYLILIGLAGLTNLSIPSAGAVLAILALAAGVLLLLDRSRTRLAAGRGILLLGAYLILVGLLPLINIHFQGDALLLAALAVAAGVLIFLRI